MKAKKVVTGAVAALSFLALAATGVLASTIATESHCARGKVVAVGSGYAYPGLTASVPTFVVAGQRTVTLQCDAGLTNDTANSALGTLSPAMGTTARTFLIPPTPDKDGIYAAALTALADDKMVEFRLYSAPAAAPATTLSARQTPSVYHRGYVKVLNVLETSSL